MRDDGFGIRVSGLWQGNSPHGGLEMSAREHQFGDDEEGSLLINSVHGLFSS
jgi:hypothetical protein